MCWKVSVLCSVWVWSWGGSYAVDPWQASLDNISQNLDWDMSYLRDTEPVNYSEPVINTTYTARSEFDMRAMGPLYNSTKLIIDIIANQQAYPEGVVSVSDGYPDVTPLRVSWRPLLTHYAGPAALLVAAALLLLLLPLSGLCWCCCVWCGRGRRRRPFDRKYDACLKGCLAIVLIALLTLFLFGVVCAFATETQWEEGANGAGGAVRAGVRDAQHFLNATQAHVRWLLVNNYQELAKNLNFILDNSGVLVGARLSKFSRAVSVSTLNRIMQQLDSVVEDLRAVINLTATLEARADNLHAALRGVKTKLLYTLDNCTQVECGKLKDKNKINQLETTIQYNKMPDVRGLLRNVSGVVSDNISAEVAAGHSALAKIQLDIRASVTQHTPRVRDAIAATGARLADLADTISLRAHNLSEQLHRYAAAGDTLDRVHHRYGPYRRYIGLGTAIALLAITCLMVWGLMCGVCGKRPDVYGASDCCNKGAGASCLLCGMAVMFVVGAVAAAVLAVYFAAGVATQRFICDPLTEPRDNRLFADLEHVVRLEHAMFGEQVDPDYNMTAVLVRCHRNETIYQTLHLHRVYDLGELQSRASNMSLHVGAVSSLPRAQLTILRPRARKQLQRLIETGLSDFNFDGILNTLETNVTSLPLDLLARRLQNASSALRRRPGFEQVAESLDEARAQLERAHADIVLPMLDITQQLTSRAVRLRDGLRFNHTSLNEAVNQLMEEATQAELLLNVHGPKLIQNMTQQIAEELELRMREYMSRVSLAARESVGRCGPLSHALNATRDAACVNVLMPTNGYWISLSWCLVLFVPVLVVAQRLARLYRHVDPYPGPLVEAEYLYDAYADRDNVPLANAYKAEKRNARARTGATSGATSGAGSGVGPASAAPPVDAHARRYNDMAPKHWEEGPPRYHGPTEYERPPPYYYPGPNDRQ